MKKILLSLIILLIAFNLKSQCDKYQLDRGKSISKSFVDLYVKEQFDNGNKIKFDILDCDYNSYDNILRLKISIEFHGTIKSENFYQIKGDLKIDDNNDCKFKSTYKNSTAQGYTSINEWSGIIEIAGEIANLISYTKPNSQNKKTYKRTTEIILPEKTIVNKNEIYDKRDGKKYKTVSVGNQIWINKDISYSNLGISAKHGFGRLYTYEEAKEVCPEGTDLPTTDDWWNLFKYYDNNFEKAEILVEEYWNSSTMKELQNSLNISNEEARQLYQQKNYFSNSSDINISKYEYFTESFEAYRKLSPKFLTSRNVLIKGHDGTPKWESVVAYHNLKNTTFGGNFVADLIDKKFVWEEYVYMWGKNVYLPVKCILVNSKHEHRKSPKTKEVEINSSNEGKTDITFSDIPNLNKYLNQHLETNKDYNIVLRVPKSSYTKAKITPEFRQVKGKTVLRIIFRPDGGGWPYLFTDENGNEMNLILEPNSSLRTVQGKTSMSLKGNSIFLESNISKPRLPELYHFQN